MKRRHFVKNVSLAGVATPLLVNNMKMQAVNKKLFGYAKVAENRVLVIIRLNGGNDGLNTVIPRDQYSNLSVQRSNILIPETQVLPLTSAVGLHPAMTGMKSMFDAGRLSVIQNVGYPEQNRSHFRSMDIWTSGMMDPANTTGWIGRPFDNAYPNFPDAYPNSTYEDPFAITMGYEVSATCQGIMGNFSHSVENPFDTFSLQTSAALNDGTYYGANMEFITTMIGQANAYGSQVNAAANAGTTLSTLYDPNNPLAKQLQYVAQMISGGLETKVYVLNINGFDTHDGQAVDMATTTGDHANLLKTLSDAIAAFQDDLQLLGLSNRVAGMTFSEFGRQIASNASFGTDHGDAAPLFLFGSCLNAQIIGANPTIPNVLQGQAGVPMQIDFRDVYASVLKDWFVVDPVEIQTLFEHTVTFYPVLGSCNLGIDENEKDEKAKLLLYPNPSVNQTTIRLMVENEWVKIVAYDMTGAESIVLFDNNLSAGEHNIPLNISDLSTGQYVVRVIKESGITETKFSKLK
jgi:uncharacterized protein (DUF1501 family)|tara:strand:+ start:1032 stop:2585 length:1554 start_codon:yes stop_codon:yes gene_type:complete